MTLAANDQLQTLVSNYYHGLVTFQSYREQRDSILDGLRNKATPRVVSEPRPAPAQARADETQTRAAEPAPKQDVPLPVAAPPSGRRWIAWGGVAAAVAIAVVGWVVFQPSSETPSVAAGSDSSTLPAGAALLEQFMQRNAWDLDAVRNLEVTWTSAFSEEQRQAVLASGTYTRFSETLRGRLREEEALSGPDGSPELDTLAALAGRFGVRYSRSPGRAAAGAGAAGTAVTPSVAETPPVAADAPAPVVADEGDGGRPDEQLAGSVSTASETPPPVARVATGTGAVTDSAGVTEAPSSSVAAPAAAVASSATAACSAALLNTRRPYCSDALRSGGTGPSLAIVPAGEFEMGGEQTNDERPPHAVTIGRALAMSVYEISFAEFGAYCKATGERCPENPWGSDDFPAALVSWDEAVAYARWLSSETDQSYRLPSEAEWEYAARAGSRTRYPFGDDVTSPVAARSSANGPVDSPLANSDRSVNRNAFRLFHMIGNLREWVADHWYSGYAGAPTDGTARLGAEANPRVVRGGAYSDGPLQLRSAARASLQRDTRDRFTGFRVVRDLPP